MKYFDKKRAAVLLTAIALLIAAAVGGTVAYLSSQTKSVVNTFNPTDIDTDIKEEFDNKTKKNVHVTNTGNIAAYVRAKVVITYQKEVNGNVLIHSQIPKEGSGADYTMDWGTGWEYCETDGFWYYTKPVAPNGKTENLIDSCVSYEKNPDGYILHVEILAQAIQAAPSSVVATEWGVTVADDGTISK